MNVLPAADARKARPIAPEHARPAPRAAGRAFNTDGRRRATQRPHSRRCIHTQSFDTQANTQTNTQRHTHTHAHPRRCLPMERTNALARAHECMHAQTHAPCVRPAREHAHKCGHKRARKHAHEPQTFAWTLRRTRARARKFCPLSVCARAHGQIQRHADTHRLADPNSRGPHAHTHAHTQTHTHARVRVSVCCMCVCVVAFAKMGVGARAGARACACSPLVPLSTPGTPFSTPQYPLCTSVSP
jgi:hypothetical protein